MMSDIAATAVAGSKIKAELERAYRRSNELSRLYNVQVPDNRRTRLAATCFALAMEHTDSIAVLLSHRIPCESSAMALAELRRFDPRWSDFRGDLAT